MLSSPVLSQVTKDGKIVSEAAIRRRASREEHQNRSKYLVAESILQNSLEIEVHSYNINRHILSSTKCFVVHRGNEELY